MNCLRPLRAMETIKFTTWLVFLPVFFVASMATYFNMLPLMRLEDGQKSGAMLVNFKSSIALTRLSLFIMITCILTATTFFAGCGIKSDYTKKQMFRLYADGNDPANPGNRSTGAPLVVKRLDISPEFSGAGFVYRVDQNRFTQDYYNNYMTSPARMISDVMLEALVDSPQFTPVSKSQVPDDIFQLWGKITALYRDQRNTSEVSAVVTMALNLDRLNKDGFTQILSKTYSAQILLGSNTTPQAYIQALNRGLAGIIKNILSDFKNLPTPADNQ